MLLCPELTDDKVSLTAFEEAECVGSCPDSQRDELFAEPRDSREWAQRDDAFAGSFELCAAAGGLAFGLANDLVLHLLCDAVGMVLGIAREGVVRAPGGEGVANWELKYSAGHGVPL
jgi:hypothetical protein